MEKMCGWEVKLMFLGVRIEFMDSFSLEIYSDFIVWWKVEDAKEIEDGGDAERDIEVIIHTLEVK